MNSVFKNVDFLKTYHATPHASLIDMPCTPGKKIDVEGKKRKGGGGRRYTQRRGRRVVEEEEEDSDSDYDSEEEDGMFRLTKRVKKDTSKKPSVETLKTIIREGKKMTPQELLFRMYEKGGDTYANNLGYLVRFLKDKMGKFRNVKPEIKELVDFMSRPRIPLDARLAALKKHPDFFHKIVFPKLNNLELEDDTQHKQQHKPQQRQQQQQEEEEEEECEESDYESDSYDGCEESDEED